MLKRIIKICFIYDTIITISTCTIVRNGVHQNIIASKCMKMTNNVAEIVFMPYIPEDLRSKLAYFHQNDTLGANFGKIYISKYSQN